jgi:DNA-3-methyladenine glycosylase
MAEAFDPRSLDDASPLSREFFERSPLRVAREVLGRVLVLEGGTRLAGRIVEVEAYRGADDPASHAFRGRTARNEVMFGPAGHAYVYFTYGMHHCLNLVTGPVGRAEAVLVRAIEPLVGVETMERRRGGAPRDRLGRGPGCVAEAFGLDRGHNGLDLTRGPLWIAALPPARLGLPIVAGPRVGIRVATDRPWRFFLGGHACVSGRRVVVGSKPAGVGGGVRR